MPYKLKILKALLFNHVIFYKHAKTEKNGLTTHQGIVYSLSFILLLIDIPAIKEALQINNQIKRKREKDNFC